MGAFFDGSRVDLFDEQPGSPGARLRSEPRSAEALVAALRRRDGARIVAEVVAPAHAARYADFPPALDARLRTALTARGIRQLYAHQREAWSHVASGHDTV